MPITTHWHNTEKTILYITYEGKWTLSEYHANMTLNSRMIYEQPHNIVSIADFSMSGGLPNRFMSSGGRSENIVPDNSIGTVLFGLSAYMEMMAKVFAKVFPKSSMGMQIASNQEEAIQMAQDILKTPQR